MNKSEYIKKGHAWVKRVLDNREWNEDYPYEEDKESDEEALCRWVDDAWYRKWPFDEAISFAKCTEEYNPLLNEDVACSRMSVIRKRAEANLKINARCSHCGKFHPRTESLKVGRKNYCLECDNDCEEGWGDSKKSLEKT